jgi:hypothetical protein
LPFADTLLLSTGSPPSQLNQSSTTCLDSLVNQASSFSDRHLPPATSHPPTTSSQHHPFDIIYSHQTHGILEELFREPNPLHGY